MNLETKTEPNVKQAVPFFSVSNIEESVRYYVDGLGFEMTKKWIDEGKLRWCWLQHGGAALMLQEFQKEGYDSWVPVGKVGEGVSICFTCQDALVIYREVTSRGIQASKPFVGNGMWVLPVGPGRLQDRVRELHGRTGGDGVFRAARVKSRMSLMFTGPSPVSADSRRAR